MLYIFMYNETNIEKKLSLKYDHKIFFFPNSESNVNIRLIMEVV